MDQSEAKEAARAAKQEDAVRAHAKELETRFLGAVQFLMSQKYPADLVVETAIQHALVMR